MQTDKILQYNFPASLLYIVATGGGGGGEAKKQNRIKHLRNQYLPIFDTFLHISGDMERRSMSADNERLPLTREQH